jgi:hypothetical protein
MKRFMGFGRYVKGAITAGCLVMFLLPAATSSADVVTDWNDIAVDAVAQSGESPMWAALRLATVHAAVYEAVNSVGGEHQRYLQRAEGARGASLEAAAASAAHRALTSLFPAQAEEFDAALDVALVEIADGPEKERGLIAGQSAADVILAWRSTDGSSNTVPYEWSDAPGVWRPTPPGYMMPMLPALSRVTPFALVDASSFRPGPPPSLESAEYVQEFERVKMLGAKMSMSRTQEQAAIANFWMGNPVARWNDIAQQGVEQLGGTLLSNALLFAQLNIAMSDAQIAAWDAKFFYSRWRPIDAIREADLDGNPGTDHASGWEPLLVTPAHPEYVSAHSTVSGAAAEVLASFFGRDDVAFMVAPEMNSMSMPGSMKEMMPPAMNSMPRAFASFSEVLSEIGISRIYGGIHFDSANTTGQDVGRTIGAYVRNELFLANNAPEVPTLLLPLNKRIGAAYSATLFEWMACADPDPGDTVSYVVEVTSDPSLAQWEELEDSSGDTAKKFPFELVALIGSIALVRPGWRKKLMMLMLTVALLSPLASCGGSGMGDADSETMSLTAALEADTTYWWRVTAVDSNGKESVSEIMQFSTRL